jgi:hypothetical protein
MASSGNVGMEKNADSYVELHPDEQHYRTATTRVHPYGGFHSNGKVGTDAGNDGNRNNGKTTVKDISNDMPLIALSNFDVGINSAGNQGKVNGKGTKATATAKATARATATARPTAKAAAKNPGKIAHAKAKTARPTAKAAAKNPGKIAHAKAKTVGQGKLFNQFMNDMQDIGDDEPFDSDADENDIWEGFLQWQRNKRRSSA